MNKKNLFAGAVALLALVSLSVRGAEPLTFHARLPSKMRIDGTANMIHTSWRVASDLIAGTLVAGPGFPVEPGQAVAPGKVDAQVNVFIPVSSLKSVDENGAHYEDAMDNIMYEHLKADQFRLIRFHLTELTLKEAPKSKDAPYLFDAKGDLSVAGVTNAITLPVSVLPLGKTNDEDRLKITGAVAVKMTSFKMTPPTALAGALKTGDEVKLSFEWTVGHKPETASASAK